MTFNSLLRLLTNYRVIHIFMKSLKIIYIDTGTRQHRSEVLPGVTRYKGLKILELIRGGYDLVVTETH